MFRFLCYWWWETIKNPFWDCSFFLVSPHTKGIGGRRCHHSEIGLCWRCCFVFFSINYFIFQLVAAYHQVLFQCFFSEMRSSECLTGIYKRLAAAELLLPAWQDLGQSSITAFGVWLFPLSCDTEAFTCCLPVNIMPFSITYPDTCRTARRRLVSLMKSFEVSRLYRPLIEIFIMFLLAESCLFIFLLVWSNTGKWVSGLELCKEIGALKEACGGGHNTTYKFIIKDDNMLKPEESGLWKADW